MEVAKHGEDEKIIPLLERGAVVNTEVLCSILKHFDRKDHKFQSCYKIIMDHLKEKEANNIYTILNGQDEQSNPPMHYAIRYADSETMEDLLKHGASLCSTNHIGKMLIEYIKPSILEKHLNNCVEIKSHDENLRFLQIDYRSLVSPIKINSTTENEDVYEYFHQIETLDKTSSDSYLFTSEVGKLEQHISDEHNRLFHVLCSYNSVFLF